MLGFPSSLGFGIGGLSSSTFLASAGLGCSGDFIDQRSSLSYITTQSVEIAFCR